MAHIILMECVEREGDQYAARCLELGTVSCGDTVEEAFANLDEAIEVHLNALEELGELARVFQERKIKLINPVPAQFTYRRELHP